MVVGARLVFFLLIVILFILLRPSLSSDLPLSPLVTALPLHQHFPLLLPLCLTLSLFFYSFTFLPLTDSHALCNQTPSRLRPSLPFPQRFSRCFSFMSFLTLSLCFTVSPFSLPLCPSGFSFRLMSLSPSLSHLFLSLSFSTATFVSLSHLTPISSPTFSL